MTEPTRSSVRRGTIPSSARLQCPIQQTMATSEYGPWARPHPLGPHITGWAGSGSADLAAWHRDSPSKERGPLVRAAYSALAVQTDSLFHFLTDSKRPGSVEVRFTNAKRPYDSDRQLIDAVRTDRILEVVATASDKCRLHPLLGNDRGGSYDRFRAVHDIVGHAIGRNGFDPHGEYMAWYFQDRQYRGLARLALFSELRAEHAVLRTTGQVSEHKAVIAPGPFLPKPDLLGRRNPLGGQLREPAPDARFIQEV